MNHLVGFVDYWTRGKLQPTHIAVVSLLLYISAGWSLSECRPIVASSIVLAAMFSDYFAERLARAQKSFALSGSLFRLIIMQLKLVILYIGLTVYAYTHLDIEMTWLVASTLGVSLIYGSTVFLSDALQSHIPKSHRKKFSYYPVIYLHLVIIAVALIFDILEYILAPLTAGLLLVTSLVFIMTTKVLYVHDQKKQSDAPATKK